MGLNEFTPQNSYSIDDIKMVLGERDTDDVGRLYVDQVRNIYANDQDLLDQISGVTDAWFLKSSGDWILFQVPKTWIDENRTNS